MRRLFALIFCVVVVGGCTSSGPEETEGQVTTAPDPSQSTVATTAVASTEPEATTIESSTTAQPVTTEQAPADPVVVSLDGELVAQWSEGAWVGVDQPTSTYENEPFSDGASTARPSEFSDFCEFFEGGYVAGGLPVGISVSNATWPLGTEEAVEVDVTAADEATLASFLSDHGLDDPVVDNFVVYAVDIDNDGLDDRVLQAQTGEPTLYGSPIGSFSVLLVAQNGGGVFAIEAGVASPSSPKAVVEDSDITDMTTEPNVTFLELHFADANGDGDVEIIARWSEYESWGTTLYDLSTATGAVASAGIGCGV